jgi:hypothetical protein
MATATEKQLAYINDLLIARRADLAQALRYADHIEAEGDATATKFRERVATLEPIFAQIERGEYQNPSGVIGALQSIQKLAGWGMRSPGANVKSLAKIANNGLMVAPDFEVR